MRFTRLDLIRYGKFTDRSIGLPSPNETGEPDFHVIFGTNESGKSTIRHAISDLLFGIEPRTRYDFVHNKNEMRLGAKLEFNDAQFEFQRLKRNKQPLRDLNDVTLPDDALALYTGAADRISFEREFCLDHTRLEEGGKSILDSKDDVGRMLFEASAGVNAFGGFLDQLGKESAMLWKPRRSKDQEFYKALDAYKEAQKELKEFTTRTKTWKYNNQKVEEASEALNSATKEHAELERTRERLERIRRVAPHFQTLNAKTDDRATLGDIIALPEGAANDLAEVKKDIRKYDQLLIEHQTLIDKALKDQDGISVDESVLARVEDIKKLRDEKIRTENHPSDIAKREIESLALSRDIKALLSELGWDAAKEEGLGASLPSAILRQEIEVLANNYGRLEQTVVSTVNHVKKTERDCDTLSNELKTLPDTSFPPEIKSSLTAARALGDTKNLKDEYKVRIERSTEKLETQIAKIHPWTGSAQDLRQLAVPSDIEIQEFKDNERSILVELKSAKDLREEIDEELQGAELKESCFQKSNKPITPEEITSSRQSRDSLWSEIKSGAKAIKDASDAYEARVGSTDNLTDSHYQNADEAKEIEAIRSNIKTLKQKYAKQDRKIERIEGQLKDLMANWKQIAERLNLGDMSISSVQSWFGHYKIALNVAEKVLDDEKSLKRLEDKESASTIDIRQAFMKNDITEKDVAALTLPDLIDRAEKLVSEAETSRARRKQLEEQIQRSSIELTDVKDKALKAQEDMDVWSAEWPEKIKAANLLDSITPKTTGAALALITDLKEKLKEKQNLKESRIEAMQRDIESFECSAKTLAQGLAPDLAEQPAVNVCAALCQQLTQAEQARDTLEKTTQDLEENKEKHEKAVALKNEAKSRLSPHMKLAKVSDIKDLETAIDLSERLHLLNTDIEKITITILELGDGMSLDYLRDEVATEDLSTIAARLDEINVQRTAAIEKRESFISQKKDAETERDKAGGQADAAMAEVQRQEALAKMVEVTERFIKVHIGKRLLQSSMERYRDEKRGPLLDRAGKIFSILTLGSFHALEIDYDDVDKPQLMGHRPDGSYVDFDGLSEGTGDQLFLSLRLAAVEIQLQHTQPLPFIADDLFTNYSDDRALQGFKVLGELSAKSQVIYFTHHEHLIDIAREAIGKELNVVKL